MKGWQIVFAKEVREMARDRRVLYGAVVMPVFIIAMFVFLMGFVTQQVSRPKAQPIGLLGLSSEEFKSHLEKPDQAEITLYQSLPAARKALEEKDIRVLAAYPEGFKDKKGTPEATVEVFFNSDDPLSALGLRTVAEVVEKQNRAYIQETFQINDLPETLAVPVPLKTTDIKEAKGIGGSPIVSLLPYLIVLWAFYGGMSIVSDLVAGEKERGTMETLLISPVSRRQIAIGKVASLFAVCFVSSVTTLIGITLLGLLRLEITKDLFPTGLSLSPLDLLTVLVVLLSLCAFFAGLMVSIGAFARNIRECQTYLSLLSFIILLPAVFSQFIGFTGAENSSWAALTPVLNSALAIGNALKSDTQPLIVLGGIGENLVLAAAFLYVTIRLFEREEILVRV